MSRRSRPNRGGGEAARALKAAQRGGRGGRRGGGKEDEEDDAPPKWMATVPNALGERYVPTGLSSASNGYPTSSSSSSSTSILPLAQFASNTTQSSSVTFVSMNDNKSAASSSIAPPPPVIYRSSVHGIPQSVEVSDAQLLNLTKAITATRQHDFEIQNALLQGSGINNDIIGGGALGGVGGGGGGPLFEDELGTPLFGEESTSSSPPSSQSHRPLQLASTNASPGSLPWLRTQVGHALESLQFRRRLIKAVQSHVLTLQAFQAGFASHRELMAQLQDFRSASSNVGTASSTAATSVIDQVQLVQRATQASIDWLLVHADEADLPRAFAAHAQRLTVVDTSNDAAVSLDVALHDKVKWIQDLGLGFSRVDILDAFHQVAGDYKELTSSLKKEADTGNDHRSILESLDEKVVLWVLFDWFDLRTAPSCDILKDASKLEMSEEERQEVRENENIVIESMWPDVAKAAAEEAEAAGTSSDSGTISIPVSIPDFPEGGFLQVSHPTGNLYPLEPPMIVFTHPLLSIPAKRQLVHELYQYGWTLIGEGMVYNLYEWLQENLVKILKSIFPEEIEILLSNERQRIFGVVQREKESSLEYKKKQAKILAKKEEMERLEEAERCKNDKIYAQKVLKQQEELNVATSKRIGAAVGMFDKLRREEEEEEEKRRKRIEQMKTILETESQGQQASSSPLSSSSSDSSSNIVTTGSTTGGTNNPSSIDPSSGLLTAFPELNIGDVDEVDHSLLESKDALEINDPAASTDSFDPSTSTERLFDSQPSFDPKLSQKLLQEWNRIKESKKYRDIYEKRRTLPAQLMKDDILRMIQSQQVTVLSGSTGCGKSTQTPQFVLDSCIESGIGSSCSILCTQPRRLAAIAVAERVAEERTERIGDTVGYSIRLESKRSKRTRLLFCTTGVVLRYLESSPDLKGISHIIVDEVHERSIDSDFLLIILKGLLLRRPDLKLILMSATLNASIFTNYFQGSSTIDIPGRAFPVESRYLEDVIEATKYEIDQRSEYARKDKEKKRPGGGDSSSSSSGLKQKGSSGKSRNDEIDSKLEQYHEKEHTKKVLESMTYVDENGKEVSYSSNTMTSLEIIDQTKINYELIVELVKYIVTTNIHVGGSILIFLSGMAEISTLVKDLKRDPMTGDDRRFCIYPLHSLLSSQEQQRVFEVMTPSSGRTKIVISTNLAETSLTIEDVTVVIDSGRMKEMQYDSKSGMSQLVETNVSLANARQRAGRAGRVRPGTCYYLYTRQRSQTLLAQPIPEMLRAPLEQLALRIKSLNLGSISNFLSRAIEPPSQAAIEHVVEVLRDYNALERREEVLTPLGFHLAALPVDARIGKMMMSERERWIRRHQYPILTIASSMSVRSPFVVPFEKREEVDEIRRRFTPYQSDHLTLLAAYNGWRTARAKGRNEERAYCSRNFLSFQTLTMIYDMKKQLCVLLAEIGFLHRQHQSDILQPNDPVNQHASNTRLVEAVIVAGLYPHIARLDATGATDRDRGDRPRRDDRPPRPKWMVREGQVSMHPSSVLFNEHAGFDSPFLVYHERLKTADKVYVRDSTIVGSYALLLFGVDMVVQHERSLVILDDWLSFKLKPRTAALIADLRLELRKLLVEKIQCPALDIGGGGGDGQKGKTSKSKQHTLISEDNEARGELRRVGPASMLNRASSSATSNLLSGLGSGALSSSGIQISSAPDLISVVAMLLAEEDLGRKKRREGVTEGGQAAATMTTTTTAPTEPNTPKP